MIQRPKAREILCYINLASHRQAYWDMKKFRPERDSNPWPLPYRAALYQLSYHANWELTKLWVRNIPVINSYKLKNTSSGVVLPSISIPSRIWLAFLCIWTPLLQLFYSSRIKRYPPQHKRNLLYSSWFFHPTSNYVHCPNSDYLSRDKFPFMAAGSSW